MEMEGYYFDNSAVSHFRDSSIFTVLQHYQRKSPEECVAERNSRVVGNIRDWGITRDAFDS